LEVNFGLIKSEEEKADEASHSTGYKKSLFEERKLECEIAKAQSNCTRNSNHRSLLGLAVIHDYPKEGAILSRKCHTWKDYFIVRQS